MLKALKLSLLVIFFIALNLAFVNCSKIYFKLSENPVSLKSAQLSGGNGGGYDGKPGEIYDLIVADWNCEGKPAPYATLEILNSGAALTVNTKEKCARKVENVKLSDLVTSPVDKEVLAYRGSLFFLRPSTGLVDLSRIMLAWCRSTLPEHAVSISQSASVIRAKVNSVLGSASYSPMLETSTPTQIKFSSIDATLSIDRLSSPLSGDLWAVIGWQSLPLQINGMECIGLNPPVIGTVQFKVNTPVDGPDAAPGDGICASSTGFCTLRAAMEESNAQVYPALVNVPDGVYDLASGGELIVSQSLTLQGASQANTIIQANAINPSRIFNVTAANVTFANLTVQNGNTSQSGGGIYYYNTTGNFVLRATSILNNTSSATYSAVGGVYAKALSVSIQNSIIKGNSITAISINGSNGAAGLVIENPSNFINGIFLSAPRTETAITDTTFENNTATANAGGARIQGNKTIKNSSFNNNSTLFTQGGGISLEVGSAIIDSCVFTNNSSGANGGAIYADSDTKPLSVLNSTFYNNSAIAKGGALLLDSTNGNTPSMIVPIGEQIVIQNSTIVGNSAGTGGGVYLSPGAVANVQGTIWSANSGGNCLTSEYASLISQGYNIDSATSCGFAATGDLVNTDPRLVAGPPVNNGGPTSTIALQISSPAIDAIPFGPMCPISYDQRGTPRSSGVACDIGAFEK